MVPPFLDILEVTKIFSLGILSSFNYKYLKNFKLSFKIPKVPECSKKEYLYLGNTNLRFDKV